MDAIDQIPEDLEWDEYAKRRANGECTCDLLPPFGHVTCADCNGWSIDGSNEEDEFIRELGLL